MTSVPHVTSSILKAAEECSFETERAAQRSDGVWTPGRHDDPKCRLVLRVIKYQAVAKAISISAVCEFGQPRGRSSIMTIVNKRAFRVEACHAQPLFLKRFIAPSLLVVTTVVGSSLTGAFCAILSDLF